MPETRESRERDRHSVLRAMQFLACAAGPGQFPDGDLPEIALVGRSNVGKSSLINKLSNRRNLAKTSGTPGKTRTINFYQTGEVGRLVDLPGYGYARVGKEIRRGWGPLIENYLKNRSQLRAVLQLVDIRHPPTQDDVAMNNWLEHYEFPLAVIATKADKVSRGQWAKHVKIIRQQLTLPPERPVIVFSAKTGEGSDLIREYLVAYWQG